MRRQPIQKRHAHRQPQTNTPATPLYGRSASIDPWLAETLFRWLIRR